MSALCIGLDPGPENTAWALWDAVEESVLDCGIGTNSVVTMLLQRWAQRGWALRSGETIDLAVTPREDAGQPVELAVENPAVLGKQRVHAVLLETAHWAGVFGGIWLAHGNQVNRITYHRVRTHITRDSNANEAAVKASLISRFAPGCKPRKNVGAFALVPTGRIIPTGCTEKADEVSNEHVWSAIAVAVCHTDARRAA